MRDSTRGAQLMLLSGAAFAAMGACVRLAGERGIPVLEIIAVRAAISLALSALAAWRRRVPLLGRRRGLLLARGAVGFASLAAFYYALVHLPLAEATLLQYLHPMFTALLAFLLLGERPGLGALLCTALSLAGLAAMAVPAVGSGAEWPALAVAAGVAGALGSGLAYTLVRRLAASEDPAVIVLYFPLVCLPATLLLGWRDFVWPSGSTWGILVLVGVFTQLGQVALTRAMQVETAARATAFSYSQVVFAALLGGWLFGEWPDGRTLAAGALILAGAVANLLCRPAPGVGR
ncbi:MAG: membrane protein [Porticoccaceae bacterium]|nr:MAG: membrane protein [Porticoccaceae bacterium]